MMMSQKYVQILLPLQEGHEHSWALVQPLKFHRFIHQDIQWRVRRSWGCQAPPQYHIDGQACWILLRRPHRPNVSLFPSWAEKRARGMQEGEGEERGRGEGHPTGIMIMKRKDKATAIVLSVKKKKIPAYATQTALTQETRVKSNDWRGPKRRSGLLRRNRSRI